MSWCNRLRLRLHFNVIMIAIMITSSQMWIYSFGVSDGLMCSYIWILVFSKYCTWTCTCTCCLSEWSILLRYTLFYHVYLLKYYTQYKSNSWENTKNLQNEECLSICQNMIIFLSLRIYAWFHCTLSSI